MLEGEERSLSVIDTKEKFLCSTVFVETLRQESWTICSAPSIKIYRWQYISPFFDSVQRVLLISRGFLRNENDDQNQPTRKFLHSYIVFSEEKHQHMALLVRPFPRLQQSPSRKIKI